MRKRLVIAAWKAYLSLGEARRIAGEIGGWAARNGPGFELALAPSFPHIVPVGDAVGDAAGICAQDADLASRGAYTGHTPPQMLADAGCRYVLLGHSEMRRHKGETDGILNRKIRLVLGESDLRVVLCIGESRAQRDGGGTEAALDLQLARCLDGIPGGTAAGRLDVAYEPVWAISSENPASPPDPSDVGRTHRHIRRTLEGTLGPEAAGSSRILYGGSVDASNVAGYVARDGVDGVLVGSASTRLPGVLSLLDAVRSAGKP